MTVTTHPIPLRQLKARLVDFAREYAVRALRSTAFAEAFPDVHPDDAEWIVRHEMGLRVPAPTGDGAALTRDQKEALLQFMGEWMDTLLGTPIAYYDLLDAVPGIKVDDALDFFVSDEICLK
ncbi:MAG TPA: hypothetical protein VNJ04_18500 [Gemmatimonadaceae bacterium]|nr:hypothetical protein [Gemmatimonadaceae bacterium]